MKYIKNTLAIIFTLIVGIQFSYAQPGGGGGNLVPTISGPTSASVGQTKSYSVTWTNNGNGTFPPAGTQNWSVTKGTITTQNSSSASINWTTAGTGYLQFEFTTWDNFYYDEHFITITGSPPSAPTANAASSVLSTAFTANWSTVSGVTSYKLDVSEFSNFSPLKYQYTGLSISPTSKSITGLDANKTYYYRVWAVNGAGTSPSSNTITVPGAPITTSVTDNQNTSFTANWNTVTGATSYRIDVSQNSAFSSYVSGYNNLSVSTNYRNISGLTPGILYYYRVRAVNGSTTSYNSTTGSNTTTLISPPNVTFSNATSTAFTATWGPTSGATGYLLDISSEPDFSSFVSGYQNYSLTTTSKEVSGLPVRSKYYFRVRSVYAAGYSDYSNVVIPIDNDQNYIRTMDVMVSGKITTSAVESGTITDRSTNFTFFDGLGRPMQSVAVQASQSQKDIIQPIVYDAYGREAKKYLPFTAGSNEFFRPTSELIDANGNYIGIAQPFYAQGNNNKVAEDSRTYTETTFEPSPLSRPVKQYGAGAAWYSNNKYVSMEYLINDATTENIIAWDIGSGSPVRHAVVANYVLANGYYASGQLSINVTKDEQGNAVREYTNKIGQVILKRVQADSTANSYLNDYTQWASTYYVYDDFGNLRYVLPPVLTDSIHLGTNNPNSTQLNNWAFQYKYDGRKKIVEKKVPGSGWVYMVYDKRDRLVLTQDANQRNVKEWNFTKYDILNRPVMTGIYTHSDSVGRQAMLDLVSTSQFAEQYDKTKVHGYTTDIFPTTNLTVHTITFYDNYDFRDDLIAGTSYDFISDHLSGQDVASFESLIGQVTGTKVNVLDSDDYLWSVSYYDDRYRAIQSVIQNHKDSIDRITSIYDFVGRVEKTKTTHSTASSSTDITRQFVYDHTGRLLKTYHQIDNEDSVLLIQNKYNELGELITKQLHSRNETDFTQQVDYRYNIRGWLSSINDPSINSSGLFNFQLKYNDPLANGGDAQYNGNISQAVWKTAGNDEQSYGYYYDDMNRITEAKYFNHDHSVNNDRFNEAIKDGSNSGYDLNGNIKKLQRKGQLTATSYGLMDNLSYTYAGKGNQLTRIDDGVTTQTHENGFKELTEADNEYAYDDNGNMIKDDNKGISSITYNAFNLPSVIKKSGADSIVYTYDATGRKLKQTVYGAQSKTTDYTGEFIYENDTLRFINHEEGRILPDTTVGATYPWEYQYHLKDHLGNVRVTFSEKTTTTEYKATLEDATQTEEQNTFANYSRSGINAPVAYNHTPDGGYSQLLHGGYNSQVGLAKSFEVDPGDIFDIEVFAKYQDLTSTPSQYSALFSALVGAFSLNPTGGIGLDGSQAHSAFQGMFSAGPFIDNNLDDDDEAPKAYLNYILFDEDFNLEDFGFDQIDPTADQSAIHDYLSLHVKVQKKGYLYIYLSNENPMQVDVFFDDLRIVHHSAIEQGNDYYPFGLTFNSYQRENSTKNNYLYNGKELQDELDLGWMDYGRRMYSPEIGRWSGGDPLAENYESISPYAFVFDNPIRFFDFDGGGPGDIVIIIPGADFSSNGDLGDIGPRSNEIINDGGLVRVFPGQIIHRKTSNELSGTGYQQMPDIYGLIPGQIPGLPRLDKNALNVATQAMFDYIVENKKITEGKLVIYGYSFGGVLANHLAKRLEEANIAVDQLYLVDAAAGRSSSLVDMEISDNVLDPYVAYTENAEGNSIGETLKQGLSQSKGGPGHRKEGSKAKPVNNVNFTFRWGSNGKATVNHSNIDTESWTEIMKKINEFLNN